jgi:hypothetical protein
MGWCEPHAPAACDPARLVVLGRARVAVRLGPRGSSLVVRPGLGLNSRQGIQFGLLALDRWPGWSLFLESLHVSVVSSPRRSKRKKTCASSLGIWYTGPCWSRQHDYDE